MVATAHPLAPVTLFGKRVYAGVMKLGGLRAGHPALPAWALSPDAVSLHDTWREQAQVKMEADIGGHSKVRWGSRTGLKERSVR